MAITNEPIGTEGRFTGATEKLIVPSPGAGEQHVLTSLLLYNSDNETRTLILRKKKTAGSLVLDRAYTGQGPGESIVFGEEDKLSLDDTDEEYYVLSDDTANDTEPFYDGTYVARVTS